MEGSSDIMIHSLPKDEDVPMEIDEIASIKARVKEIEDEAEKLRAIQSVTPNIGSMPAHHINIPDTSEIDGRSIYIGNVDYSTTAQELEGHFHGCGAINRVTVQCNKFTGAPKGFAYIEFAESGSVMNAVALDDSTFKGRQIKVIPKRTNRPGMSTTDRPARGFRRGRSGRFGYQGYRGRYAHRPYYARGRGSHYYTPY